MISLIADENFPSRLVRAVRGQNPAVDFVRVQDLGMSGVLDPDLLEWADRANRVILSHDTETLIGFAYERMATGKRVAGLIELIKPFVPRIIVQDIITIAICGLPEDFENQVRYLPI